jgi:uncharacterized protein involved in exopolysaccharide biosynthesis
MPDATVADRKSPLARSQYLDYSRQEAEFSAKYGAKHLAVINLRTRMQVIRRVIIDDPCHRAENDR